MLTECSSRHEGSIPTKLNQLPAPPQYMTASSKLAQIGCFTFLMSRSKGIGHERERESSPVNSHRLWSTSGRRGAEAAIHEREECSAAAEGSSPAVQQPWDGSSCTLRSNICHRRGGVARMRVRPASPRGGGQEAVASACKYFIRPSIAQPVVG
jgi:hypothetical protein